MSAFVAHDITIEGLRLIAECQAGGQIEYTRIALGDGYMHQAQTPHTMTALVNEVINLEPSKIQANGDGTVTVGGFFTNADLLVGFFYREIGLFARKAGTPKEILYCYGNAADFAEWIPPSGTSTTVEKIVDVVTVIGTAVAITATINPALTATLRDIGDHNNDPAAHPYTNAAMLGVTNIRQALDTLQSNKANIEAPQDEFDFPFSSGNMNRAGRSTYIKNQEQMVTVYMLMQTDPFTDIIGRNYTLGILPEGFRPSYTRTAGAFGHKADQATPITTLLGVRSNGTVYADVYGGQVAAIFGQVSFYVTAQ